MHGWFQKLFKSRVSLSTQHSTFCHSSPSSQGTAPSKPLQPQSALSSQQRWNRKYDLLVCHADSDAEEAHRLVSFLEASPQSLRCFLWHRDVCLGGAVHSEFCQAMKDSHLQALLITPNFLQDDWCKYMMHQTLAEGPMSNRLIPLVQNVPHSQYPQELKFCYYINLSTDTDRGYNRINKTVLQYLEDLSKKEKTCVCNKESSNNKTSGHDCSHEDLMLTNESSESSVSL